MIRNQSYRDLLNSYLGFLVTTFVLFPHLVGAVMIPYVVFVVIGMRRKELHWKPSLIGWFFILLYAAYAIGALYTNHTDQALRYLEYKLSFLVLPVLLSFRFREGTFSLEKISNGLIIGVFLASLYGILNGVLCYMDEGTKLCFLTGSISPLHHPSYFVAYLITAMFLAWLGLIRKWRYYSLWWVIPFTIFGIAIHVLSLSLAGILFMLLVFAAGSMYWVYKRFGKWVGLGALLVMPVMAYLFVTRVPQVEGEWTGAKWYAEQYMKDPEAFVRNTPYPMSGSEERLILWTASWQELRKHPMGVGTGNLDDTMGNALRRLGQDELAEKNLNPHNQFLQTGLEIGWIGLSLLFLILGYALVMAIKHRNGLLLLLTTCLAFNCLFESMLQRQSGIVFFTFWLCLVAVQMGGKKSEAA